MTSRSHAQITIRLVYDFSFAIQTSNTLSWALYCLAINPEVQEKLRSEVQAVVGSDELVTPEHIARMPYLHDCIKETQRCYIVPSA